MERIDFEITELEKEKPKKVFVAFVELHENHVEYKTDYYSDEKDDETDIWNEDTYHHYNVIAAKEAVKGFYIHYRQKIDQWKVNISVMGFTDDIYIMFNDEKKAKSLYKKLVEWKFCKAI